MVIAAWIFRRIGALKWLVLWLLSPKYIIGVNAVIVNNRGELYLQKHRFWENQSWGLPGGLIKSNESPQQALAREIREETGKSCKVGSLLTTQLFFRRGIEVCFAAELGNEPMKLDKREILNSGFFRTDELPQLMLDDHRQLIQEALLALKRR